MTKHEDRRALLEPAAAEFIAEFGEVATVAQGAEVNAQAMILSRTISAKRQADALERIAKSLDLITGYAVQGDGLNINTRPQS